MKHTTGTVRRQRGKASIPLYPCGMWVGGWEAARPRRYGVAARHRCWRPMKMVARACGGGTSGRARRVGARAWNACAERNAGVGDQGASSAWLMLLQLLMPRGSAAKRCEMVNALSGHPGCLSRGGGGPSPSRTPEPVADTPAAEPAQSPPARRPCPIESTAFATLLKRCLVSSEKSMYVRREAMVDSTEASRSLDVQAAQAPLLTLA